jgi:hypothetical protein
MLGLCTIGTVDLSASGKYVVGRSSVLTGWGRAERGGEDKGKRGGEIAERVVGRENNGL